MGDADEGEALSDLLIDEKETIGNFMFYHLCRMKNTLKNRQKETMDTGLYLKKSLTLLTVTVGQGNEFLTVCKLTLLLQSCVK